eukprot:gene349-2411_t
MVRRAGVRVVSFDDNWEGPDDKAMRAISDYWQLPREGEHHCSWGWVQCARVGDARRVTHLYDPPLFPGSGCLQAVNPLSYLAHLTVPAAPRRHLAGLDLGGTIPKAVADLSWLKDVSDNYLTGTVPSLLALDRLTALYEHYDVHARLLMACAPVELLTELAIERNQFTAEPTHADLPASINTFVLCVQGLGFTPLPPECTLPSTLGTALLQPCPTLPYCSTHGDRQPDRPPPPKYKDPPEPPPQDPAASGGHWNFAYSRNHPNHPENRKARAQQTSILQDLTELSSHPDLVTIMAGAIILALGVAIPISYWYASAGSACRLWPLTGPEDRLLYHSNWLGPPLSQSQAAQQAQPTGVLKCSSCTCPISAAKPGVMVMEQPWHRACLVCAVCKKTIQGAEIGSHGNRMFHLACMPGTPDNRSSDQHQKID